MRWSAPLSILLLSAFAFAAPSVRTESGPGMQKIPKATIGGPEELEAMTNGERFRRGLPPRSPAHFKRRSIGGVHRVVPESERLKARAPAPSGA